MARNRGLPGPGGASGRGARGGASGRKRGIGHLTVVPDPDDEHSSESLAVAGSAEEGLGAEPGGQGRDKRRGGRRGGAVAPGDAGTGAASSGGVNPAGADPGSEEAARAICLRLLTSGPRTRAQLATALRKRKVPAEIAESVLSRFTEVGLIDDAAFARAWVESRHHSRGLARRALSAELRQRGIPDGEVRSAVGLLGPQDELATARRLVAKRVAASRGKPMPARARQLMGMLARKGYPAGLAAQVVREALEQDRQDGEGHGEDLAWICEDTSGDDWA
jgi:regulatory protein